MDTPKRVTGKQRRSRSYVQNAVPDQGLHCLQIVQSFFFRNINLIKPDIAKIENGLFHFIVGRVYSVFNGLTGTVEPQWLEPLWDHGNLFETWVVRATEG